MLTTQLGKDSHLDSDASNFWKTSSLTLSDEQARSEIQLNRTSVGPLGFDCSSSAPMLESDPFTRSYQAFKASWRSLNFDTTVCKIQFQHKQRLMIRRHRMSKLVRRMFGLIDSKITGPVGNLDQLAKLSVFHHHLPTQGLALRTEKNCTRVTCSGDIGPAHKLVAVITAAHGQVRLHQEHTDDQVRHCVVC